MPATMKIKSAYSSLPSAERKVADFILEDTSRASLMVISEIAQASGVSVPSVTRLAKKLGYDGFLDFRVALAGSAAASASALETYGPIRPADDDQMAVDKLFAAASSSIMETLKSIDKDALIKLAGKVNMAKRVFLFGTNGSKNFIDDCVYHLAIMGYDAVAATDPDVISMYYTRFTPEDVFIGISRSGRTKLLIDALRAAKNSGSYCAFLSNYINSPASYMADAFFCTSRIDDVRNILGRESNLGMMAFMYALSILLERNRPL